MNEDELMKRYWSDTLESRDKVILKTVINRLGASVTEIEKSINRFNDLASSLFRIPNDSKEEAKKRAYTALVDAVFNRFDNSTGEVNASLEKIAEAVPTEAKFGIFFSVVEKLAEKNATQKIQTPKQEIINPAEAIDAIPGIEETDMDQEKPSDVDDSEPTFKLPIDE